VAEVYCPAAMALAMKPPACCPAMAFAKLLAILGLIAILGLLAAHNREATSAATSAATPVTACEPLGADVGAGAGAVNRPRLGWLVQSGLVGVRGSWKVASVPRAW
jgi:hypothetical protein